MRVIEPGHIYELRNLDAFIGTAYDVRTQPLSFVKREGPGYPGNVGPHPGTTLQEVLRACIERVEYLDNQIEHYSNQEVLDNLRHAIFHLENRAAHRHNRALINPNIIPIIELAPTCPKCFHIGCPGDCHNKDKNVYQDIR